MSVQEIQTQLTKLSPQELGAVARFLDTLHESHSPDFAREMGTRHCEMDAGRKVSEAELSRHLAAKSDTPSA